MEEPIVSDNGDVWGCKMRMYVHTNVPAPYRKHQCELIAREFPGSRFYFHRKQSSFRPWSDSLDGWPQGSRHAGWLTQLKDLIFQPWGSAHLFANCAEGVAKNLIMKFFLAVSASIGHSKVLVWNDAGFPGEVKESKRVVMRWFHRWCNKQFGVFTPGKLGKRFSKAQGFGEDKIVNAYFSHDVASYAAFRDAKGGAARVEVRKRYGIRDDKILILTVSRYEGLKRLIDIAEALRMVERENPTLASRCEFMLIGEGESTDHLPVLDALKKIRVHLVKHMPPDDVMGYYCAADMSVFASEHDIWGLVVNEALTMGVPVICTDIVGAAEVVHDGENGFLVPVHSPRAIADAIMKLGCDDELRKRFSENARTIENYWRTEFGIASLKQYLEA